jgi:hypothetical protein
LIGFKDILPILLAVSSPSQSLTKACISSWIDMEIKIMGKTITNVWIVLFMLNSIP